MDDFVELPNMPGYVSIKEAAKMLDLSTRRVYDFVVSGRLRGVRAVNAIMIPLEDFPWKTFRSFSVVHPVVSGR
jgi:hypothetical protein